MRLEWKEHKEIIFQMIKDYRNRDKDYFKVRRAELANDGYDAQEIDAIIICEKREEAAIRKLFYPYVLEFLGKSSEDAQKEVQQHLDEYNQSIEIRAQIMKKREEDSEPSAESQEPGMR